MVFHKEKEDGVCDGTAVYAGYVKNHVAYPFIGIFQKFNRIAIKSATVLENYSSQNPTWRGFHLLAIDGRHASLPVCKQTIKAFGTFGSENCPNAGISVLYDVLSGWIIDPIIGKATMNEREYASRHIEFLTQTLPQVSKNTILLMDRGYPSKAMIELMENSEISFVM